MQDSSTSGKNPIEEVEPLRPHRAKLERVSSELNKHKNVDEELYKAQADWEKTFDAISDWVAMTDLKGRILRTNRSGEDFTGISSAQIVGQSCCKLVHGSEEHIPGCPLKKMLHSRQRESAELKVPDTNRWLIVTVDPIVDKEGNIVSAVHITRDITERKRTEEALRESEEKYREIFELAPDGIVTVDLKGMITSCNSALLQRTGYTKEDFAGKHISKIPTARLKDIPKYLKIFGSLLMGKVPKPFEFMWIHKNGSKRWGELRVSIIRRAGKITGFQAITRDITDRKRADEALRKSGEDKKILLNTILEHVVYRDTEMRVLWANKAACESVSLTFEQLAGRYCYEIWHQHNKPCVVCPVKEVMKTGQRQEMEVTTPDGRIWFIRAYPILNPNGKITGIVNTTLEITERKRAEEALRESENSYRAVVENAVEGIVVVQGQTLQFVNPALVSMIGYSEKELLTRPFIEFIHPDHRERAMGIHIRRLKGEEVPPIYELKAIDKKGNTRWLENNGILINWGNKPATLNFLRDITGRKKAEKAVREERDKVQNYLDVAGVMLVAIDVEERVGLINTKGCDILGYEEEEIIGKNWFDNFLPERIRKKVKTVFKKLMAGNLEPVEYFENPILTKDGDERLIAWHNTILRDEKGEIIAFLSSGEDITDRKRAEETYRSLVDHSLQGLAIFQDRRVVFANQTMADITGYTVEEMLASPSEQVQAFVHPDDCELIWNRHRDRLNGEELPERYEFRGIRKDGSTCWLELHASRIEFQGKPAIQAAYVDITERKRAEEALRESQENYRMVSGLTSDYIVKTKVEPNGQMVFVSATDRLEKMTGYAVEELRSQSSWSKIVHPDDFDKFQDFWKRIVSSRKPCELEFRGIDRKQQFEWLHAYGQPILDEKNDRVISIVFAAKDITEYKKAEQKLLDDQEQLKSLASQLTLAEELERRRIASELHDQISQTLVISKIKLEALCKSGYGEELDKALDEVCNSLGWTIQDTRTLTFDLSSPILYELGFEAAVAEWLDEQIRQKHGIETEFEDDGQHKPLDDDIRVLLFRDVRELLINVVKHANAQNVKVSVRKVDDQICVTVEDDGVGFDPDKVASMAAKKAEFGLFSIRQRLEQLRGHLKIESEPGRGSRITMFAPLKSK